MGDFSHLTDAGQAQMVDISLKVNSRRTAEVSGLVRLSPNYRASLDDQTIHEIVTVSRIAGIQAAKKTAYLVPLCHQVPLSSIDLVIDFSLAERQFKISATAKTTSPTGVEMEAMVAANIAAITIYDMIKGADPGATLNDFQLVKKTGGKGAMWTRCH